MQIILIPIRTSQKYWVVYKKWDLTYITHTLTLLFLKKCIKLDNKMYMYIYALKENIDTSCSLLSTILLTYNLPFSSILWGRKKGAKTQNACYGKKEIIIFSHSFILFFFLLPSLLCRARPVQLCFLQVTNCWSCCFSFLFLLLLLLRFLFSVCALLPLLINFDSLSTLQEITHPLAAHSDASPGPSSPSPHHLPALQLPHSSLCFFIIFQSPHSAYDSDCHCITFYTIARWVHFFFAVALSPFLYLCLSLSLCFHLHRGWELRAASKAACECANKWAFQIVANKFAAIERITWTSLSASEMPIAGNNERKTERAKTKRE